MFIVEDGTNVPDANSYASVEYANAYFSIRMIKEWKGEDEEKQAWLIRATDYIDARFGPLFLGKEEFEDQSLCFPRVGIVGIKKNMPDELLKATCEYALRAIDAVLLPDPVTDATGYSLQSKKEEVGPLEESTAFVTTREIRLIRPYPAADILLSGLISNISKSTVIRH